MNNEEELSTNLTLGDLKVLATLIDACSQRGVFKAAELTAVGLIYDKLIKVLQSSEEKK